MAKLQKSTAVLAASTLLGLFFFSGTVVAAQAAPSAIAIKAADPIGTIGSNGDDADSDDDSSKESKKEQKQEQKQEQKKLEREARDEESAMPIGEKKRKELREKFGNKDSLGLPPIVIHPEDDGDEEDDSSAPVVKPRKKPATSLTSPSPASTTAPVDPSITTNTQSLKGGQLATGSATIAGSGANQSVATNTPKSTIKNQSPKQQLGSSSVTQEQVAPIDVKTIDFTGKTPADKFVEAATASIGAMAIGAISLGVVTMIRGKRQQKDLKAEYQYSSTE